MATHVSPSPCALRASYRPSTFLRLGVRPTFPPPCQFSGWPAADKHLQRVPRWCRCLPSLLHVFGAAGAAMGGNRGTGCDESKVGMHYENNEFACSFLVFFVHAS